MKHSKMTTLNGKQNRSRSRKRNRILPFLLLFSLCSILFYLLYKIAYPTKSVQQTSVSNTQIIQKSSSNDNQKSTDSNTTTWEVQAEPVKLPILMYHAIHVMAPEEAANANLIVDPTTFESHLKALQEAGYYTLSPEEAYKVLTENVLPASKKVVWLTFDDSLWDFYSHAYPPSQAI